MYNRDDYGDPYDSRYGDPDAPFALAPSADLGPYGGVSFTLIGIDPDGKDVYQGSDGHLYTGNPTGPNGMGPYTGPGVNPTGPVDPGAGGSGGGRRGVGGGANLYALAGGPPPEGEPIPGAPTYTPPGAFVDPSLDDAMNEPGYEFARSEGQRALEASRAAAGTLNTGNTLKDLIAWGNSFANQNYGTVRNRKLDTYMTNYKTQFVDPYSFAMDAWRGNTDVTQHTNDMDWQHWYDQWRGRTGDAFQFYTS